MKEKPLTVVEFADFVVCSPAMAYKLLNEKKVRSYKIGAHWRVPVSAAEEFMRGTSEQPSQPTQRKAAS
jgi:excisionase family DNA binding protein